MTQVAASGAQTNSPGRNLQGAEAEFEKASSQSPPLTTDNSQLLALNPGQSETRTASCYGPGLYGGQTASGMDFNPETRTAATNDLPLGAVITVTDKKTGKSTTITADDRGPFGENGGPHPVRGIDLSEATVNKLGYKTCDAFGVRDVQVTRKK